MLHAITRFSLNEIPLQSTKKKIDRMEKLVRESPLAHLQLSAYGAIDNTLKE